MSRHARHAERQWREQCRHPAPAASRPRPGRPARRLPWPAIAFVALALVFALDALAII